MVNTLEVKTSEFVDLKKIREYIPTEKDSQYQNTVYMCDCDGFGGGEPSCDCNR